MEDTGSRRLHFSAQFVKSAAAPDQVPADGKPIFAFIGRSNVGKSTFINLLTGSDVAQVSSKPGKTKLLNIFDVNGEFYLLDMPGYGYAKSSQTDRQKWIGVSKTFLKKSPNLACLFQLIDFSIPSQNVDVEFSEWAVENAVPLTLVYTKEDKLRPTARKAQFNYWLEHLKKHWEETPPFFVVNMKEQQGIELVRQYILQVNAMCKAQGKG